MEKWLKMAKIKVMRHPDTEKPGFVWRTESISNLLQDDALEETEPPGADGFKGDRSQEKGEESIPGAWTKVA
jgi:hypothetical protein